MVVRRQMEPEQTVTVELGTSAQARDDDFVAALARMINRSYGYSRISQADVARRLRAGSNRVLHLATRGGQLVGCCSSTLHTPWTGPGCGHWGLLVVDVEAQGTGVASALVRAAESRLADAGQGSVQIEYSYHQGDRDSERLLSWYEGSLGFRGPRSRRSGFRICSKRLHDPRSLRQSFLPRLATWLYAVLMWLFCGKY